MINLSNNVTNKALLITYPTCGSYRADHTVNKDIIINKLDELDISYDISYGAIDADDPLIRVLVGDMDSVTSFAEVFGLDNVMDYEAIIFTF